MTESSNDDDIIIRDRYRKFIVSGLGRSILTRAFSLGYIVVVTRNIPLDTLDLMILLTTVQLIVVRLSSYGLTYSLTQKGISQGLSKEKINNIALTTASTGIPISILASIIVSIYLHLSWFNFILYTIVVVAHYLLELVYALNSVYLDTDITLLQQTIYSIVNSISVPLIYLLRENFSSILIAWSLSYLVTFIPVYKTLIALAKHFTLQWTDTKAILKFGFPVYISDMATLAIQKLDIFVLYLFFQEGDTSLYFYVLRIAVIAQEFFVIIFSGIFPILSKIYTRVSPKEYFELINSFLRLVLTFGGIFYFSIYYQSDLAIYLILSKKFINGLPILRLILSAYFIRLFSYVLRPTFKAIGKRREIVFGPLMGNAVRILGIVAFYKLGPFGLAIAISLEIIVLASYFIMKLRNRIRFRSYVRVALYSSLVFLLVNIIPAGSLILVRVGLCVLMVMLYVVLLVLIKPLERGDFELIEKVFGSSLGNRLEFIKVHISHSSSKS